MKSIEREVNEWKWLNEEEFTNFDLKDDTAESKNT